MGGGKGLPYDAEIQYIQSTGSQYIDTGFRPDADTSVKMKVLFPQQSAEIALFDARNGPAEWTTSYGLINFTNSSNIVQMRYGGRKTMRAALPCEVEYEIYMDKNELYIDGVYVNKSTTTTAQTTPNLVLFAMSRYYNNQIVINAGKPLRVYWCKIYDNGVLVRDFIPVRIEQVGALYDSVTQQIFYKGGSGNFTLGPDKT